MKNKKFKLTKETSECWKCGCQRGTHPIPTCKQFVEAPSPTSMKNNKARPLNWEKDIPSPASEGKCSGDCVRLAIECPLHNRKIEPSRETAGWNDFPLRDAIMKWHKIQNEYDAYDKPKEGGNHSITMNDKEPKVSECWKCGCQIGYVQGVYQKIFDIVYDLILAAEKRGEEKGKQTCGFCAEEHERIVAAAKAEGYKEGAQDGEGTKNGVKRYRMGFDAGKAEGGKEMLTKAIEKIELILPLAKGYAAEHRVGSNGKYIEEIEEYLASLKTKEETK